jgi:hypothetical protein
MSTTDVEATVHIGDGVVVVRRKGQSMPAVANVLGTEDVGDQRLFYLDRLIHKPFENELGGYSVTGAISTIIAGNAIMTAGASA